MTNHMFIALIIGLLFHTAVSSGDDDICFEGPIPAPWELFLPIEQSCGRVLVGLNGAPDRCSTRVIIPFGRGKIVVGPVGLEGPIAGPFEGPYEGPFAPTTPKLFGLSVQECEESSGVGFLGFSGGVEIYDTTLTRSVRKSDLRIKFNTYYSIDSLGMNPTFGGRGGSARCTGSQSVTSPGQQLISTNPNPNKPLKFRFTTDLTVSCELSLPFFEERKTGGDMINFVSGVATFDSTTQYRGVCTECGCNYDTRKAIRARCSERTNYRNNFTYTVYLGAGGGVALLAGGAFLYRKRKRSFAAQQEKAETGLQEQAEGETGQESQAVKDEIDEDGVSA